MCAGDSRDLAGVIEALVSALQAHRGHVGIVAPACKALLGLTINGMVTMALSMVLGLWQECKETTAVQQLRWSACTQLLYRLSAAVPNHGVCR